MGKKIFIVRHAKSSWADMSVTDKERKLNARGKKDAPRMAAWCKEHGYIPQLMISSTAVRARKTAAAFHKEMKLDNNQLLLTDTLYHAPAETYLENCYGLPESIESVMLFGHNPGITYLANEVHDEYIDNVPTCGVLVISTSASTWDQVDFSNCTLQLLKVPKKL